MSILAQLSIAPEEIERRREIVGLVKEDRNRIRELKEVIADQAVSLTDGFFDYLRRLPEARELFRNPGLEQDARVRKMEHLAAMGLGEYGSDYAEQRLALGLIYNKAQLDLRVFLGAFQHLLERLGEAIMKHYRSDPEDGFAHFTSLQKLAAFDVSLIVDSMVHDREQTIRRQQSAIRELSIPVLKIREQLLLLPIIGVIDSSRAKLLTEGLLHAIRMNRAKVSVLDITGVAAVDSRVANHLIQTIAAARLMGANVIVSGVSPEVAQTLVTLGVDVTRLNTVGDLQGGLEEAERLLLRAEQR